MTHMERWKLKKHLMLAPIGHAHAPIEFGEKTLEEATDHDLVAWHMNAHGVFHPDELHEVL